MVEDRTESVIELGTALRSQSSRIVERVLARWLELGDSETARQRTEFVRHAVEMGTRALADFLISGKPVTRADSEAWDEAGEHAYLFNVALSDVTKTYLYWREESINQVHEIAASKETSADAIRLAIDAIRLGTDVSLVRMAKRFQSTRAALEFQLAEHQAHLEHQALHDPLTGLANRALLIDRLGRSMALTEQSSVGSAVLFVDLDHFKLVNDRAGHSAGDELLVEVAARLSSLVRPGDTISRLGGDEFVVLCENLQHPVEDALSIAEAILSGLSGSYQMGKRSLFATASVGVAVATPGINPEGLLSSADRAMYRAKERGRGRVELYDPAIDREAIRHAELDDALHKALTEQQLYVAYQPIFDLTTNAEVTQEALARWEHPIFGNVTPAEFIPIAEENGLILEIGEWILVEACKQCVAWRSSESCDVGVAVNVSGRQLETPDFQEVVHRALTSTSLPARALTLEITESLLTAGQSQGRSVLRKLKKLGVRIAVDDFGTGYSSFSWLARLPLDVVKIDRGFMAAFGLLERESAIVQAMVELAHTLGLTAVAEGVETDAQLARLKQIGCDQAQGYLLGRPERLPGRAAPMEVIAKRG